MERNLAITLNHKRMTLKSRTDRDSIRPRLFQKNNEPDKNAGRLPKTSNLKC